MATIRAPHHSQPRRPWESFADFGQSSGVKMLESFQAQRATMKNPRSFRHGLSASPEYRAWASMWSRVSTTEPTKYAIYGGRGIRVCERWRDFLNFVADMGMRPSPTHSLDRIDNDRGYEPGNCRWATRSEQNLNRRGWRGKRRLRRA